MKQLSISTAAIAILGGCVTHLGDAQERAALVATWTLEADADGALVDPRSPDRSYPSDGFAAAMEVRLFADGRMCADTGQRRFCGGPPQGIPYVTRARVVDGRLCLAVRDVFGREVSQHCDLGRRDEPGERCQPAQTAVGSECVVCTDRDGRVTETSCGGGEFGALPEAPGCERAEQLGAELFVGELNASLLRIGLSGQLPVPDVGSFVEVDRGEITLGAPSCADVTAYLDDEFSDDSPGTDDYVFGPEATAECLREGRCRVGQLVTRAMATACERLPVGCAVERVSRGIVGSAGYALSALCPGTDQLSEFGVIERCVGSPLVLDLDGDGLALRGAEGDRDFALFGPGRAARTGWIAGSDDALLALDVDGDGRITGGHELFGEATGGWAGDGFAALRRHDANADGWIDASDPVYASLLAWVDDGFAALRRHDANADGWIDASDPVYASLLAWVDDGDAVSQPNELIPLSETGVDAIPVHATPAAWTDASGNQVHLSAMARGVRPVAVHDVWFTVERPVVAGVTRADGEV